MKILLISPNTLTVPYPVYPIGLDYVAGCIPTEHQVRIADLNVLSLEALEEL
ncbi:MAG: B12-binding domain-containing radical SAM protein, partial [Deltaproteobacteria bacterium HGW-Deltaproteobacteria-16]